MGLSPQAESIEGRGSNREIVTDRVLPFERMFGEQHPLRRYWIMTAGVRTVEAPLWAHPLGFELRVMEGDDLHRTQVHRESAAADADALVTRDRLADRGWIVVSSEAD